MNVELYIPNPLRCYQCQVFGHHEDYCIKKPICGNCGGERHCNDDHNCKNTAKCVNCNANHPVFSRDCPTWKKEKAILKVKYEKSITFPDARKLVEEQFAAPGKSYASITKVAGVHVSCTDAQTQTDETCIAKLKSATSNAGSKPTLTTPLSGMAQIKMGVVPSTSTQPTLLKRSLPQHLLKRSLRRTQKTKSTQVEQQRDQMIPYLIPLKLKTD